MPAAQLLLGRFQSERLGSLVVERLSALHGLGAVGNGLHELGYLLVLLGELGILDGELGNQLLQLRLHRVGDALNLVGQALKTNPDHDNLLALNPAPPSVAQPKRTAPKKSEKV